MNLNPLNPALFALISAPHATPRFAGDINRRMLHYGQPGYDAFECQERENSRRINELDRELMEARGLKQTDREEALLREYLALCETLPKSRYYTLLSALEKNAEFCMGQERWSQAEDLTLRQLEIVKSEDLEPRFHDVFEHDRQRSLVFVGQQLSTLNQNEAWQATEPVPESIGPGAHKTGRSDISHTSRILRTLSEIYARQGKSEDAEKVLQQRFLLLKKTDGLVDIYQRPVQALFDANALLETSRQDAERCHYAHLIGVLLSVAKTVQPHALSMIEPDMAESLRKLAHLLQTQYPNGEARTHVDNLRSLSRDYFKTSVSHGRLSSLMPLAQAYRALSQATEDPVLKHGYANLAERYTDAAVQLGLHDLEHAKRGVSAQSTGTLSDPEEAQKQLKHYQTLLDNETEADKRDLWQTCVSHYQRVCDSMERKAISDAIEPAPDIVITGAESGFTQVTIIP